MTELHIGNIFHIFAEPWTVINENDAGKDGKKYLVITKGSYVESEENPGVWLQTMNFKESNIRKYVDIDKEVGLCWTASHENAKKLLERQVESVLNRNTVADSIRWASAKEMAKIIADEMAKLSRKGYEIEHLTNEQTVLEWLCRKENYE